MSPIQRFTRDGASKYVWAAMTLAAIIGLAYATTAGSRALNDQRAVSRDRAVRYVDQVLDPPLGSSHVAAPITGELAEALEASIGRSILADEGVARVRIWSTDGTLLFSTDRSDRTGSNAGLNDSVLREASREGPITRSDYSDTGGADDPERSLFRTYVPLEATAVAEIDQTGAMTIAPVRTEWRNYQILAGALVLLFLVMIGLSLRDPFERINFGAPFATSSVPAGFSLIDDDRLHAVQEVYRLASERVARLQEKLSQSEEARRRLEGEVQQVLSKASPSARIVTPAAPAPVSAPRAPEPTIVQVPESEVMADASRGDAWAPAPAGPLARAARAQNPTPTTSRKEKPAAEKPKRTPKRQRPKPEKPAAAPRQDVKTTPAAAPRQAVKTAPTAAPVPPPTAAPVPARQEASVAATPAATSTPAPTRTPVSPDPEISDAKAHAAALDTFIRLTESDRQPHDTSTVDQGAVRAALARTAARKKPGGERLQPHDAPSKESLGGPPTDKE